ncbi:MAG: hypothetical protein GTO45_36470 [Candidatus Aminicenantes bacterium]|nr:hypothetical protein [Candidatus Aminicenantes bacterium]NIM84197.1 hypothetical protein [Candidatus Aminicenantes bacterium]NIN23645.1 hypothetical protein [Candidatus Aminicenantes bacterium]NIN47352.1 hypothetical protein [Candidatus Aminicenantes bacterium]NIN90281.1 hypothetical protein [Candidatus Aminicenantes bacterium]
MSQVWEYFVSKLSTACFISGNVHSRASSFNNLGIIYLAPISPIYTNDGQVDVIGLFTWHLFRPFPLNIFDGFRGFMEFVKKKLKSKKVKK